MRQPGTLGAGRGSRPRKASPGGSRGRSSCVPCRRLHCLWAPANNTTALPSASPHPTPPACRTAPTQTAPSFSSPWTAPTTATGSTPSSARSQARTAGGGGCSAACVRAAWSGHAEAPPACPTVTPNALARAWQLVSKLRSDVSHTCNRRQPHAHLQATRSTISRGTTSWRWGRTTGPRTRRCSRAPTCCGTRLTTCSRGWTGALQVWRASPAWQALVHSFIHATAQQQRTRVQQFGRPGRPQQDLCAAAAA